MERKSVRQRTVPVKFREFTLPSERSHRSSRSTGQTSLSQHEISNEASGSESQELTPMESCLTGLHEDICQDTSSSSCNTAESADGSGNKTASVDVAEDQNASTVREPQFRCCRPDCGQKFMSESALARHTERHETGSANGESFTGKEQKGEVFMCEFCSKTFTQKGNLKAHLRTHNSVSVPSEFRCDAADCRRSFSNAEGLRRHKLIHLGIKLYNCDVCGVRCSSNVALKEHKARHLNLRPHTCDVCSKSFRQVSCFKRHLQTHSTDQPYCCDVCQRTFSQATYLRSHMRKHTGEAPFECTVCHKYFKHASDRTRHMSVHSGEKRFLCGLCPAQFKDPSSCRRHVREHSSTTHYVCPFCSAPFKRAASFQTHMAKHSSEIRVDERVSQLEQTELGDSFLKSVAADNTSHETRGTCDNTVSNCSIETGTEASNGTANSLLVNENMLHQINSDGLNTTGGALQNCLLPGTIITDGGNIVHVTYELISSGVVSVAKDSLAVNAEELEQTESSRDSQLDAKSEQNNELTLADIIDRKDQDELSLASLIEASNDNEVVSMEKSNKSSSAVDLDMALLVLHRPDATDLAYMEWQSQFAEAARTASLPFAGETLQAVCSVWTSLVADLSEPVGVCRQSENHCQLALLVRQLSDAIDTHLKLVQQSLST